MREGGRELREAETEENVGFFFFRNTAIGFRLRYL